MKKQPQAVGITVDPIMADLPHEIKVGSVFEATHNGVFHGIPPGAVVKVIAMTGAHATLENVQSGDQYVVPIKALATFQKSQEQKAKVEAEAGDTSKLPDLHDVADALSQILNGVTVYIQGYGSYTGEALPAHGKGFRLVLRKQFDSYTGKRLWPKGSQSVSFEVQITSRSTLTK